MSKFIDRLKQSLDSRLPHFSTSIPYVIATVLIMLVPLTVVLSQQETRIRSNAAPLPDIQVRVNDAQTGAGLENAFASLEGGEKYCQTSSLGGCEITDTGSGTFTVYAIKGGYDPLSKSVTVGDYDQSTTFELVPIPDQNNSPEDTTATPAPTVAGSARLEFSVDEVGGFPIKGASVALDRGSGGICTTNSNGICDLPMHRPSGTYFIKASKPGYKPSVEQKYQGNGKSSQIVNLKLEKQGTGDPTPPKDDGSQPPDTGNPDQPDDTGSNPPGPDDLKCLGGSCETPTPTPPYCITPAPSEGEPPDTGTPPPNNQSIMDMVRERINEAFSRFGDFFNTTPAK